MRKTLIIHYLRLLRKRIVRRADGESDTTKDHEYSERKQVDEFDRRFVRQMPVSQPDAATLATTFAQQPPVW